ncbi:MAG TPA: YajQ family cyclic di-GMP-binding protein [Gemmatimonadales bacterium]
MAQTLSFDVTTGADLQEVDNAVNQAMKEVTQRYDFRGTDCRIVLDRDQAALRLDADDEYRMKALFDVLQGRLIRRGVPVKNLQLGDIEDASGGRARRIITITQGIDGEIARQIVKAIKGHGFKKVQVAIQGDQLRVSSPSKDELQDVMQFLRGEDYGIELQFGNYR